MGTQHALKIYNEINTYSSESRNSKISINYKTNKINVEIHPYDQKLVNQLNKNFSGLVKVSEGNEFDEQSRTALNNSMQGGLLISYNRQNSIDGDYNYCTLGFTARRDNQDYLVTAGHCIVVANKEGSSYWYQGGEIIGANSTYLLNQSNDSGLIKLTSSKYATNNIYKYSSRDSSYTSYSSSKYVGQRVCISGATSGFQCGEVEDINAQINYYSDALEKTITVNRIDATYASAGGDSGSPVWYSGVLYGVHTNCGGAYNGIGTIVQNLGITSITN